MEVISPAWDFMLILYLRTHVIDSRKSSAMISLDYILFLILFNLFFKVPIRNGLTFSFIML